MANAAKWLIGFWLLLWPVCAMAASPQVTPADQPPRAAPTEHVDVYSLPPPGLNHFNAKKVTEAYLKKVPAQVRQRSNAYVNGGYVVHAAEFVWILVISALLLHFRIFVRMRDWTNRHIAGGFKVMTLAGSYLLLLGVLTAPFDYYQDFVREHRFGLSAQPLAQWGHDYLISFIISLIALSILSAILYAVIRRARKAWWLWGAGVTVVFMAFMMVISPTLLAPQFNDYSPLPDSAMKDSILTMARANDVPAENVYTYNASKQTNRISAHVSGFLGTTQIALNDNLLDRCTPSEVLAVAGHEIGHYVMDHQAVMLTWLGLLGFVLFWLAHVIFRHLNAKQHQRWAIHGLADPAGLPLLAAIFLVLTTLATPVTNSISRNIEHQADIFGLNAARQPDAFAKVVLKTSNYRKLDPSPVEEFLFFDHPSGRNRILTAMRWKAAHRYDPDIINGPLSPAVPYTGPEKGKAKQ